MAARASRSRAAAEGAGAPRAPAPSLSGLDELVAELRAGGLDVAVTSGVGTMPLPDALDTAAFRIVQEALTNAARHASGAPTAVRLALEAGTLVIEVENEAGSRLDGVPRTGGRGLMGMRERALALGGRFEAGPRADGGFVVRARLPLDAVPA